MIGFRWLVGPLVALAWVVSMPAHQASAQPHDEIETRNLATVRAGFDAWANGTGSPYDALAEDATWDITGDTVIVLFDAEGTARDGVPYRDTYSWFLTLTDNRIVNATAFFDTVTFNDLWRRVPVQS